MWYIISPAAVATSLVRPDKDKTERTPRCPREGDDGGWENHHPIDWETTVLDHGRGKELLVKETLHIQMAPPEEHYNQDGGLEVLGCWTTVMRRQGGRRYPHRPLTSNDVYSQ